MKISPTYANRADLTDFEKWRFSLEERIENHPKVMALYRRYFFLPDWLKESLEAVWIILSIIPVILCALMCLSIQKILSDEFMQADTGILGAVLYVVMVGTITYFHPIGWLLVFMTVQFLVFLQLSELMRDYDLKLRLEQKNKK